MTDRVKEVLVDFSQTTTISGLYFINKYQSTLSRLLWVFISLFLLILCTWQCTVSFSNYFARPTIVKTKMHIIEKNAESIKEDMPIDSTNVANRLKRQVEQATTQSSGIVDAYMDENCYDVSDLDMWTSNSSPTTTASTHLPNESSKTTRPSPLAETNSLTSGQSVSPFFVSSSKFNSVRPLVSDIDPSTAKNNEAGGQEYDYDDGGNCTADSLDTTSDRITKSRSV